MAGSQAQLLQFAVDASADNLPVSVTWTEGDWVHIALWASEAACTTTLEDNLGNTFTFIGSEREAVINTRVHHFYAHITVGGAATVTGRWFSDTTPFGALAVINRQMAVKRMAGVNAFQAGGQQDVLSENPTHACVVNNSSAPAYLSLFGINMQSGTFTADTGNGWTNDGFITGSGGGGSLDGRAQSKSVLTVGSQSGQLINASSDRGVVVMAIFTEIPPPYSDAQIAGWTPTPAGHISDTIDDGSSANDTDYVTSPLLRSVAEKLILDLTTPLTSGSYTIDIRIRSTSSTGNARVRFLDSGGADVGVTAIQGITTTLTTYSLSVTLTGTATQVQIEVTT
ncbi:MAG TPA: hypothetical protein PLJ74_12035 [Myxococcota bacterium]|mgnify:CR=1 FL=1|nr:hypothetical protein [Myxococcota bacterium]